MATLALKRVPDPLEFGVVITGRGRPHRALPREADLGRGVLRHDQHRHLRARARGAARRARRRARTTSRRSCSRSCSSAGAPLYGFVADGYWQDIGNLIQYQEANRDALDGKVDARACPACGCARTCGWGRASLVEQVEQIEGPAVIGNYCAIDESRLDRPLHGARQQRDREGVLRDRVHASSTRTPTSARAPRCAAR